MTTTVAASRFACGAVRHYPAAAQGFKPEEVTAPEPVHAATPAATKTAPSKHKRVSESFIAGALTTGCDLGATACRRRRR